MKHVLPTLLFVALCGCSGSQSSEEQAGGPSTTQPTSDAANGAMTGSPVETPPTDALAGTGVGQAATPPAPPPGTAQTPANAGDPLPTPAPVRGIAIGEPNPATPHSDNGLPSFDGYGDLRLGTKVAAARAAWKGELHGDAVESGACGFLLPGWSSSSRQFGLMFDGGRFVRYDIGSAKEAAPGGGRVGMTQAQVSALYPGRVTVQPHKYVAGGKTLRVTDPGGGKGALVFEADETGKITSWRVGLAPQVDYVEGCS